MASKPTRLAKSYLARMDSPGMSCSWHESFMVSFLDLFASSEGWMPMQGADQNRTSNFRTSPRDASIMRQMPGAWSRSPAGRSGPRGRTGSAAAWRPTSRRCGRGSSAGGCVVSTVERAPLHDRSMCCQRGQRHRLPRFLHASPHNVVLARLEAQGAISLACVGSRLHTGSCDAKGEAFASAPHSLVVGDTSSHRGAAQEVVATRGLLDHYARDLLEYFPFY